MGGIKLMKRLLCLLLSILFILSLCSCGMLYIDDSKEKKAYKDTITVLFNALDNKDADTIYNLFSPSVREQDKDLNEQIEKLLSEYKGPIDEIGWDGLLAGGASYEYGEKSKNAYTTFPVRSGDTYYWCYLDLMYENTFDEKQIGITQLNFYTADEYCIIRYDDNANIDDSVGLEVYTEKTLDTDIRCINGWPHKYSSTTKALNIDHVNNFLKNSDNFTEFKNQFGEPNAENIYAYYNLQQENEKPRYLEIGVDDDSIHNIGIVDDFKYIETIFDDEE